MVLSPIQLIYQKLIYLVMLALHTYGNEDASVTSLVQDRLTVATKAEKALARKLARRLNSCMHPDRIGSDSRADEFQLVREMVAESDLDGLRVLLLKEGKALNQPELQTLHQRLSARLVKMQGSPSFRVAQLYLSGDRVAFRLRFKALLKRKILELELTLLGVSEKVE